MAWSQTKPAPEQSPKIARAGKYRLDEMDPARVAKNLVMFRPTEGDVHQMMAAAEHSIPGGLAAMDDVLRVFRYNPDCIFAVTRKSRFNPDAPVGEGFISMLPVNALGMQLLMLGAFNGARPDLRTVARHDERPAGFYWWMIYAPGPLAAGIALWAQHVSSEQYAGVDIIAKPVTPEGKHFIQVLGFKQGAEFNSLEEPSVLWTFHRAPLPPPYDSYVPKSGSKEIGITVARTFDDLMKVVAVRNAVYVGEQECPYDEEYDGNDLTAVHLLAYIGDEPVGCLRLRFFADFAKFERVAIRKEFRKSRAAIKLVQAGLKFCQKKGYRRVIGHAQARLASFWTRFGFHPMEGRQHFVFSDYDYVEMVAELERDPEALTLRADPYVMIRPEGRWHVTGILENSAARAATNPSVAKKN
jgi:predicted GNAT family N-acyltransferase